MKDAVLQLDSNETTLQKNLVQSSGQTNQNLRKK